MKCERCQEDNPPRARFCLHCGSALAPACMACGAPLPAAARACPRCGEAQAAPLTPERFESPERYTPRPLAERILSNREALEGERKQITVLFADLKGSMELLADRDPEEAQHLLDGVLERMMEAVHRYEGTVNQVMGDGIMALFGAPVAHEDHAVRACYAALRMKAAIARYAAEVRGWLGVEVAVRIGLNSGDVVVRGIGDDLRMSYSAVGRTTHLAARLEQMAPPGSILVSEDTLALAAGYAEARSLGPQTVKGLDTSVECLELIGASAARTRFGRSTTRALTPFVGREPDLARFVEIEAAVRSGHGRVVAIVGEPGVGKSRLLYEVTQLSLAHGWRVLDTRAEAHARRTAFGPVIELLRDYFHVGVLDDALAIRTRVAEKLKTLGLTECESAVLALLDVTGGREWDALGPSQRLERTLDAVTRIVLREAQEQPFLLVFEDLHWVDAETQGLLDRLVEQIANARLLLVLSYRPEYRHGWTDAPHYDQVRLAPLSGQEAERLLDALLGNDPALAAPRRLLLERTAGNPFFLEESLAMLVDSGTLTGARGLYRVARSPSSLGIPATVQAVLAARIDRLSRDDKRLLQTASVVGLEVPVPILQAAVDLDEDELRTGLLRLQVAEFLYEARRYPDAEVAFKHPLTHDVAYASLLVERRRALHARVLDALEKVFADRVDEHVAALCHHAVQGAVWEKAVVYGRRAGARAALRSASREAIARFEDALRAVERLAPTPENLERAMDLRFDLRNPLFVLGDITGALSVLGDVARLAERAGDAERLGRACAYLANAHFMLGNPEQGIELAERATAIATARQNATLLGVTTCHLGQLYYLKGQYMRTTDLVTQGMAVLAQDRNPHGNTLRTFQLVGECFSALALAQLGRFPEAITAGRRCREVARSQDTPFVDAMGHWGLAAPYVARGDAEVAIGWLEQARAACRATELRAILPWIGVEMGLAYLLCARVDEAVVTLDEAIREGDAAQILGQQSFRVAALGEALLRAGRLAEAAGCAVRALELARRHSEPGFEAYGLRVTAEVAAGHGHHEEAHARYTAALARASQLAMAPLVARCHLGLGLLPSGGHDSGGVDHLARAAEMFDTLGMTFWRSRVDAARAGS
jgi:class 3 adenylate cyclase/tetratricopeptide (TPR) repeat protein